MGSECRLEPKPTDWEHSHKQKLEVHMVKNEMEDEQEVKKKSPIEERSSSSVTEISTTQRFNTRSRK